MRKLKHIDKLYWIKVFLCVAAIVVSIICLPKSDAAEINCYSGKSRIYHGYGDYVTFNQGGISFVESSTNHILLINADCVIMTRLLQGENFHYRDRSE